MFLKVKSIRRDILVIWNLFLRKLFSLYNINAVNKQPLLMQQKVANHHKIFKNNYCEIDTLQFLEFLKSFMRIRTQEFLSQNLKFVYIKTVFFKLEKNLVN